MTFGIPQIILTTMLLISMGICIARYGEHKRDTYDLTDCFIGPAVTFALLWWGGFYGG